MIPFLRYAPWLKYLTFAAGPATGVVSLWIRENGVSAAASRRGELVFEPDLSTLPETPAMGAGKGAFLDRLRKRQAVVGARPLARLFSDHSGLTIQMVEPGKLPVKTIEELSDTLHASPRELFATLEGDQRWMIFTPTLDPVSKGRIAGPLIVVGLDEEEANGIERWGRAQGFLVGTILPAAVAALRSVLAFLAEWRIPTACVVVGTHTTALRAVIHDGAITTLERSPGGPDEAHSLAERAGELFGEYPFLAAAPTVVWEAEAGASPGDGSHLQFIPNALEATLKFWTQEA